MTPTIAILAVAAQIIVFAEMVMDAPEAPEGDIDYSLSVQYNSADLSCWL